MQIDPVAIFRDIQTIKKNAPLIHHITNYVVMEQTANALLAIGASPVMAHAKEEVAELTAIASALVVNIGTLSSPWVEAMELAVGVAKAAGKPAVLDPAGVGATAFRTQTAHALIARGAFSVIRGNASELYSLATGQSLTKGVDSTQESLDCLESVLPFAKRLSTTLVLSGAVDLITDGSRLALIRNGVPLMTKVTGMGCTASSLVGAFLAVNPDPFFASVHAMAVMGITGELAATKGCLPGSFKTAFIDQLFTLSQAHIHDHIRAEIQLL